MCIEAISHTKYYFIQVRMGDAPHFIVLFLIFVRVDIYWYGPQSPSYMLERNSGGWGNLENENWRKRLVLWVDTSKFWLIQSGRASILFVLVDNPPSTTRILPAHVGSKMLINVTLECSLQWHYLTFS